MYSFYLFSKEKNYLLFSLLISNVCSFDWFVLYMVMIKNLLFSIYDTVMPVYNKQLNGLKKNLNLIRLYIEVCLYEPNIKS